MNLNGLDEDTIEQLLANLGPAVEKLFRLFADDTRVLVARMVENAASGPTADLTNDAHSLKGSAATYGMAGLSEAARQLETACQGGDDQRARELLDEIEKGIEDALKVLLARTNA